MSFKNSFSQDKVFYFFEGVIDKYPIEMFLYNTAFYSNETENFSGYAGYYVYNNHVIVIDLYENEFSDKFELNHSSNTDIGYSETFSGSYDGKIYKGKWTNGEKILDFTLIEI